jgi:hypothetical protein
MHYDITGKNNNARSEHELSLVSQLVYQTHCDNVCPYIYNGQLVELINKCQYQCQLVELINKFQYQHQLVELINKCQYQCQLVELINTFQYQCQLTS